jgi:hypothetical protein
MIDSSVSWRTPAILALVLFGGGGAIYWYEYSKKPQLEERKEESKRLFPFGKETIESVELRGPKGTFRFKCAEVEKKACVPGTAANWVLESPLQVQADGANTNALVSALEKLVSENSFDLALETPEKKNRLLREYQLSPEDRSPEASRRITLRTHSGAQFLAFFGDTNPINDQIYTMTALEKDGKLQEDSKVLMVSSYFKTQFDHDLNYWRNKKILSFLAPDVVTIEHRSAKSKGLKLRREGSAWWIKPSSGPELPGERENIESLLTALQFLTGSRVVVENSRDPKSASAVRAALQGTQEFLSLKLGFRSSSGTEAASTPKGIELKFRRGGTKEKPRALVQASGLDPLFELEVHQMEKLDKSLGDLQLSSILSSLERFEIKAMQIESKALGKLELQDEAGQWKSLDGELKVDPGSVAKFLDGWSQTKIQSIQARVKAPESAIKITWRDGPKGKTVQQIEAWVEKGRLMAHALDRHLGLSFLLSPSTDHPIEKLIPQNRDAFQAPASPSPSPSGASLEPSK